MRFAYEGHNLGELAINLGALHPQGRAVEVDVLPPGQLGVEAGAHPFDLAQGKFPACCLPLRQSQGRPARGFRRARTSAR